jgi:flagellar P-ring protein precursor FlgI
MASWSGRDALERKQPGADRGSSGRQRLLAIAVRPAMETDRWAGWDRAGRLLLGVLTLILTCSPGRSAVRIKEIAAVEGVRENQLIGYGLVVGLNGTGDKRQTYFSAQTLANLLERMGVQVPPTAMLVRNTAAVIVTANLPAFAQPGTRLDVNVAAIGDATNLQGGLLLLTPLKAASGEVYAVAQGPVLTAGFVARGGAGNSTTMNHPTAGRIPGGAIVERAPPSVLADGRIRLQLRQPDFTTAARMAKAINARFQSAARCENAALVEVQVPEEFRARTVEFLAEIENLTLEADRRRKIIINERTGTITAGKDIRIRPVSILHGALTIEIQTSFAVSQPAPFGAGQTTVTPEVKTAVREEKAQNVQLKEGATVEDLARALTALGATARDIVAIMQALEAAGALDAEVEVI